MFGLFSNTKTTVGLDIKARYIRFVKMRHDNYEDHIVSYGEIVPDEPFFRGNTIVDEEGFAGHLRKIVSQAKTRDFVVSLPEGFSKDAFEYVFRRAGLRPRRFLSPATALGYALVPPQSPATFLVIVAEDDATSFASFGSEHTAYHVGGPENHSVISNLNRVYIEWYDEHKEKFGHVLMAGARAKDGEFLSYVSRETKIPILRANIFTNLRHDVARVPVITKDDSYKYAVAVGLTLG